MLSVWSNPEGGFADELSTSAAECAEAPRFTQLGF